MRITMKRYYRISLVALLAIDLFFIGWLAVRSVSDQIPDTMWTYVGKEEKLFSHLPAKVVTKAAVSAGEESLDEYAGSAGADTRDSGMVEVLNRTGADGGATLKSNAMGNYSVDVRLFGIFPLKTVDVKAVNPMYLAPSGEPVGIYVETNGLLVLATTSVEGKDGLVYEPAQNIIKTGDYILKINGKPVKTIRQFNERVQKTGGKKVVVRLRRNGTETDVSLKAVLAKDGTYKMGMWVREDTQGIGTMTYVTENGGFGALGHGITDADTGTLMNLGGGELFNTEILDIIRGEKGTPGELEGYINMIAANCIGTIEKNTSLGIFGQLSESGESLKKREFLPVGFKQDIKKGPAWIYSNIEGTTKQYAIEVEEIKVNSADNRGMVIHVTDQDLLKLTGGIVQGMSGSPVVQDGKLIGAVTHVLVDDPTRGYGAFVETMLAQG